MTKNIQAYIRDYDIQTSKRLNIKDIPEDCAVFAGEQIFDFFFKGSQYSNYQEYDGTDIEGFTN